MSSQSYEIVVRGRLSPPLVGAIDGFTVSAVRDGLTHLIGWVPDQARLHGLLDMLGGLNVELVSVNLLSPQSDDAAGRRNS